MDFAVGEVSMHGVGDAKGEVDVGHHLPKDDKLEKVINGEVVDIEVSQPKVVIKSLCNRAIPFLEDLKKLWSNAYSSLTERPKDF